MDLERWKSPRKTGSEKVLYALRDVRATELFKALREFCRGSVLDVGGSDFFLSVKHDPRIKFDTWTTLEPDPAQLTSIDDPRYASRVGDGCAMPFEDGVFDTVLNIQVLEHVMEPLAMLNECRRVMKPGGLGIFLIPQTSVIHFVPHHYYNFTRYWIREAMRRANLEIIHLKPLGGRWTSMASHFLYFFFQAAGIKGYATGEEKRNPLFYILFPLMVLYAVVSIPICMLLGLGDMTEEPNNHLVIVKKNTA